MIKLSKTSKLNCKSWSLEAGETCPGSHKKDGTLVDACKGCYAKSGCYTWKPVKTPRQHNKKDWKREGWVDDMVKELAKEKYFRWFDSGDVYSKGLAEKIKEGIEKTPNTKHWLPSRSYKFEKIKKVLDQINTYKNATVRYSSDSINGEYEKGLHDSTINAKDNADVFHCPAYKQEGKCLNCRACWDQPDKVISYAAHGQSMLKLIKVNLTTN